MRLDLPGVALEEGLSRDYPYGDGWPTSSAMSAPVSEAESATDDPLLQLPGFRIGKAAIEKSYESPLRGSGRQLPGRGERRRPGRSASWTRNEGEPGADLTLAPRSRAAATGGAAPGLARAALPWCSTCRPARSWRWPRRRPTIRRRSTAA